MSEQPSPDHGLLVGIATSLARLEGKVDGIDSRLSSIDKRLDDHEQRIRKVEATDMVTADDLIERDLEARKSRRWIIGIAVTIALGVAAELITIAVAVLN